VLQGVFRVASLYSLSDSLIHDTKTLHDIGVLSTAFQHPSVLAVFTWILLLAAATCCLMLLKRKTSYTTLFGTVALFICLQILLEASAFPVFKDSYSARPFAEKIEANYHLKNNTYVINDLTRFPNLYGLNFYMGNHFRNFDKEQPSNGYFITGSTMIEKVRKKYKGKYRFEELDRSANRFNDFNDVMVLYKITREEK
jgi:hypothetical protein